MSHFDPINAVEEDEESFESSEMEALERKMKGVRLKLLAEAFKDLAKSSKEERTLLLGAATEEFGAMLDKTMEKMQCEVMCAVKDSFAAQDKVLKQHEAAIKRTEALVRQQSAKDPSEDTKALAQTVATLSANLHAHMKAMESKRLADHGAMMEKMEGMGKKPEAPAPRKPKVWKFEIVKDDYNNFKDVIAREVMED